jgi:hypothetical protein
MWAPQTPAKDQALGREAGSEVSPYRTVGCVALCGTHLFFPGPAQAGDGAAHTGCADLYPMGTGSELAVLLQGEVVVRCQLGRSVAKTAPLVGVRPGMGLGASWLVWLRSLRERLTVERETSNISTIWRREMPRSAASRTRWRRSIDRVSCFLVPSSSALPQAAIVDAITTTRKPTMTKVHHLTRRSPWACLQHAESRPPVFCCHPFVRPFYASDM